MEKIRQNMQLRQIITLISAVTVSSLAFLFLTGDWQYLVRYWDGPNYLYVAKTLYHIPIDHPFTPYKTTPAYFACHLPLYPLLIKAFSFLSYPVSLLWSTYLSTLLMVVSLYYFFRDIVNTQKAVPLALLSLFLPARALLYHNVGATEPLFIALITLTFWAYYKDKWFWVLIFAALASITRIQGILLGPALFLVLVYEKKYRKIPSLFLIGIPLLLTFCFYQYQYGDFWAYFSWNQKLLTHTPFISLISFASTGATQTAELYWILFLIYAIGIISLLEKRWLLPAAFCTLHYLQNVFVLHEDMSRYFLPLTPFAIILAFYPALQKKYVLRGLFLIGVPLAYIYALPLVEKNMVVDWVYQNLLNVL